MTDNEIIKALECCVKDTEDCYECPLQNKWSCDKLLSKNALDLINRQKAEIDRLQGYNENLITANTALSNEILDIKSETIKEFVRKIKSHAYYIDFPKEHRVVDEDDIDNLSLDDMAL